MTTPEIELNLGLNMKMWLIARFNYIWISCNFFVNFQVEEARHTDILLLHGSLDMNTHPRLMLNVASRLLDHDHTGVSVHMYQGAGHILEPPYIPFCYASWHKLCGREDDTLSVNTYILPMVRMLATCKK